MALKCITPASALPVTVAQAKEHMVVSTTADDALIESYIMAAVELAQNQTGRQLAEATFELALECFPSGIPGWLCGVWVDKRAIELPRSRLISVESITYIDAEGATQVLAESSYEADTDSLIGRVLPAFGQEWPVARMQPGAVRIIFRCGWPMSEDTSPGVWMGPQAIATWIKVRVATMYAQREALVQGQTMAELPRDFVDGLLDPYRIYKVA